MSTSPISAARSERMAHSVSATQLMEAIEALPAMADPLDVSALDGFLTAALLQPKPAQVADWWPYVLHPEGRPVPTQAAVAHFKELVLRRHRDINAAIHARQWFDPYIFEEAHEDSAEPESSAEVDIASSMGAWVDGFAQACAILPDMMDSEDPALTEPLALIYQFFDISELEEADELLAEIETLEPPENMTEAVECVVRGTLLIADVTRPVKRVAEPGVKRSAKPAPARRRNAAAGGPSSRHGLKNHR